MDINKIVNQLEFNIPKENIYINEPMNKHTTFKIGGLADIFIKIYNVKEIDYILKLTKENSIPLTIIGNGSNILVKDEGIRGIVLKICINDFNISEENNDYVTIDVGAGMMNTKLAQILLNKGLTGYEFASGIPGTIGGAIKMNAGAYGSEIKDVLEYTEYIDLEDRQY